MRLPQSPYRSSYAGGTGLNNGEKIALGIAGLLLVIGLFGYIGLARKQKHEVALSGGTFVEGIVADNPSKVERIISSLTSVGLTYRDTDGTIKPALAESWEVANDNKTYKFKIHDGYAAEGLVATIKSNHTTWEGIDISAPASNIVQFNLPEPFSAFLSTTTEPLFPYGPYEVVKRDKKEIILRNNANFVLETPYIQKFIIKQFDSSDQLTKAVKQGEVNGSADFAASPSGFKEYNIDLPRYYVLFPNVTRNSLKKVEDRGRVIDGNDGGEVNYSLVTNQTAEASDLAKGLVESLKPKHVNLNLITKTSANLQKEDIPKRDFDFLLYGVNYGIDPDYYPFWHSSQVNAPGLNITGVKDKELDKLLESARKEADAAKRAELTKQIEDYLANNKLQKIVSQEKANYWVDPSIKGIQYGKMDEVSDRFNLVWRWYIKSKLESSK